MPAPDINNSTREERLAYVEDQWRCLGHCPSCGKCHMLRNRDPELLYHDYIEGHREYIDITLALRH